jgi:hypothetical protein
MVKSLAAVLYFLTALSTLNVGLAWIIHDFAGGKRKGALKD